MQWKQTQIKIQLFFHITYKVRLLKGSLFRLTNVLAVKRIITLNRKKKHKAKLLFRYLVDALGYKFENKCLENKVFV